MRTLWCIIFLLFVPFQAFAAAPNDLYDKRMELYKKAEAISFIPWYYFAAVDQYERSVRQARRDLPKPTGVISIYIPPERWAGPLNKRSKPVYH